MTEPATFELLPASWRDLLTLHHLEGECFGQDAWPLLDLVIVLLSSGVVRVKAVVDGQMVAFASGEIRTGEKIGWITTICVTSAFRGRGIGAAILALCEERMRQPRVRLCVRRSNLNAIRLYQQHGYRQISVWTKYYSGGEDALLMEKLR